MVIPRRRLPHVYVEGKALFLTWHLHGSLPASHFPPPGKFSAGQAFVWIDRYLDAAQTGPTYLRRPEIARIVLNSIYKGVELSHYDLHSFVIMSNHVHMLIDARIHPSQIMRSLKGFTAREANLALGLTGQSFWQKESYDHWVRDDREFERIRIYIENRRSTGRVSVVKRGVEMSLYAARTSACATKAYAAFGIATVFGCSPAFAST